MQTITQTFTIKMEVFVTISLIVLLIINVIIALLFYKIVEFIEHKTNYSAKLQLIIEVVLRLRIDQLVVKRNQLIDAKNDYIKKEYYEDVPQIISMIKGIEEEIEDLIKVLKKLCPNLQTDAAYYK